MPLPGSILHQPRIAGAELMQRPIAQPDLNAALNADDILPPRRRVPVNKVTRIPLRERNARRPPRLRQLRKTRQTLLLNMRLPIIPGKHPVNPHNRLLKNSLHVGIAPRRFP